MYNYRTPFYLPNVELFTPFQDEFGDAKTQFIRLKYRINKDAYVPRKSSVWSLGPSLDPHLQSYTGRRILGNLKLSGLVENTNIGETFALSVETREIGDFYDTVTETYVP